MTAFITKRLVRGFITLFAVSAIVFLLLHVFIDPVRMMLPDIANQRLYSYTQHALGLDKSIPHQFTAYVGQAIRGEFGNSFYQQRPTRTIVLEAIPKTAVLAGIAFFLAVILGIGMGVLAALRPRSLLDNMIGLIYMAEISMPEFWLALLMILLFAVHFHILPVAGYGKWQDIVLPAVVLSTRPMGRIALVTRAAMLEQMGQPYILAAHGKGLRLWRVITRHVLKNAGISVVTISGIELAHLLSGVIIIETIFGWPGIGWVAEQALSSGDFPLIQAVVLWVSILIVGMNLLIDVIYGWLDPRVRYT